MIGLAIALVVGSSADRADAELILASLAKMPSYLDFDESSLDTWTKAQYDPTMFGDVGMVSRRYLALARLSTTGFAEAYAALGDRTASEVVSLAPTATGAKLRSHLGEIVAGRDHDSVRAAFQTLYWLMFDDPSQSGVNPWIVTSKAVTLRPRPHPLSGGRQSWHAAKIPNSDALKLLKRRRLPGDGLKNQKEHV